MTGTGIFELTDRRRGLQSRLQKPNHISKYLDTYTIGIWTKWETIRFDKIRIEQRSSSRTRVVTIRESQDDNRNQLDQLDSP